MGECRTTGCPYIALAAPADQLASDVGVVAYSCFDECLTLGFNPRLAAVLGMSTLEVLERKKASDRNDREYSHPKFRQLLLLYRGSVRWHEEVCQQCVRFGCRGWSHD